MQTICQTQTNTSTVNVLKFRTAVASYKAYTNMADPDQTAV